MHRRHPDASVTTFGDALQGVFEITVARRSWCRYAGAQHRTNIGKQKKPLQLDDPCQHSPRVDPSGATVKVFPSHSFALYLSLRPVFSAQNGSGPTTMK